MIHFFIDNSWPLIFCEMFEVLSNKHYCVFFYQQNFEDFYSVENFHFCVIRICYYNIYGIKFTSGNGLLKDKKCATFSLGSFSNFKILQKE